MSDELPEWLADFEPVTPPRNVYDMWEAKAKENVDEWGLQDGDTLLLAMQEELGELTQARLEARAEGGDPERMGEELDDLVALCLQFRWWLVENADE